MKILILFLALMTSFTVNAAGNCNPYLKHTVRELIVCGIERSQGLITNKNDFVSSAYDHLHNSMINEMQDLLEALDAKQIKPAQAGLAFDRLLARYTEEADRLEVRLNQQIDSMNNIPIPIPSAPQSIDFTCTKQYDDSVRCR
ncbi:hypothetical protein [Novimethylophilus kurashikiensis]|uniref:hypothetical protein n=1 Tax=Novimethylophilus kurashikiensis TaxID=1825523 RepID=UPI000D5A0B1B|nr:hypothetical protein [Novimethylophilus kurashikiensis]